MIGVEEFVERLCRLGADRGPRNFPRRQRDRQILMKSMLMLLDSARTYTEPEINAAIQGWRSEVAPAIRTDHVTLRRRAFVRFYACEQDLSHDPSDVVLPDAVASGAEPFLVVGAMAGG